MSKQDTEHNIDEADIQDARARFLNQVYDEKTFTFTAEQFAEFAIACGETAPRYTDPAHPDFQAPPSFPTSLHPNKRMPDGYPRFNGLGMDAGKAVQPMKPIRPGVTLTGRTHIHDIYSKSGRSGRMIFSLMRMEIFDPDEQLLATADTSIVIREKPAA
jgi:N-terminal half of MaoC dehydratase